MMWGRVFLKIDKICKKNVCITFCKNVIVLSYLSLKIGKKTKNGRCRHIHDTTAFFQGAGVPKNLKKGYSWDDQKEIWTVNKEKNYFCVRSLRDRPIYMWSC